MRTPINYADLQVPVADESRITHWSTLPFDWNDDRMSYTWMFWQPTRQCGDDGEWTGVYTPGAWWSTEGDTLGPLVSEPPRGVHPPTGPVSSYWWPLMDGRLLEPAETAARLLDLPVALVRHGETYGLCLTGGGQTMSWHLAYAAIRCGFLPWDGLNLHSESWEHGIALVGAGRATVVWDALRERYTRPETASPDRLARMSGWGLEG